MGTTCANGCANGACANGTATPTATPTPAYSDTDGGIIYYTQGTASNGTNSNTDVCTNATTLKEYYCSGNNVLNMARACVGNCANGACPSCFDSDGGIFPSAPGWAWYGGTNNSDYCYNGTAVREYYCSNGTRWNAVYNCGLGLTCQTDRCA